MLHDPVDLDELDCPPSMRQVYELYRFHSPKKIAYLTGLSRGTVYSYLRRIGEMLPGQHPPQRKIIRNQILEELQRRGLLCEKSDGCARLLTE